MDSSQNTAPPISDGAAAGSSSAAPAGGSSASAGPDAGGGSSAAPEKPQTAGKTADGHTVAASPYERYEIYMAPYRWHLGGGEAWVIDRDGHTIPEDQQFEVLYDVLSGEPQCLTLTEDEIVETNAEGVLVTRELSALYDLNGNMLYDWGAYTYRAGFGDFIIRQKSMDMASGYAPIEEAQYSSELWDFKQDRSVMAQVWLAELLDEGKVLLYDEQYCPLAIVDEQCRVLAQNTNRDYFDVRKLNGYMVVTSGTYDATIRRYNTENIGDTLLSPEFAPLLSHDSLETGASEKILLYTDYANEYRTEVARSGLITLEDEEIFEIPSGQRCDYFDDELIVLSKGSVNDSYAHRLVRIEDGEVLAGDFEDFNSDVYYRNNFAGNVRSEFFTGYKDGMLYRLDRAGKTFAQRETHDVENIYCLGDGFISVSAGEFGVDYKNSVLDMELNEILSAEPYTFISRVDRLDGNDYTYYEFFRCSRYLSSDYVGTEQVYDIVDYSGNVLISGLNDVYGEGSDRLAVRKGFEAGLMDWSGEWIVKRSIFSELWD